MFKFRLEFLLKYRRQQEERQMYQLAEKIRLLNLTRDELEESQRQSDKLAEESREVTLGARRVSVISLYADYLAALREEARNLGVKLAEAQAGVELEQEKLIKAAIGRKIMERLKEIQGLDYTTSQNRRAQALLDEAAALKAGRKDE